MVELYASWSPGLPQDKEALLILKNSGLIDGIELCNYDNQVDLIISAGLKANIHNPLRTEKKFLCSRDFIDSMISNTNVISACKKSSSSVLGFHAGYSPTYDYFDSYKKQLFLQNIQKNARFLDQSFDKKILFETAPYSKNYFEDRNPELMSYFSGTEFIQTVLKSTKLGYLFDLSHNMASASTKIIQKEFKGTIEEYFSLLMDVAAKETYQMHLNVPTGSESVGFVDAHNPFLPSRKLSKKALIISKEFFDSCPNIKVLTMEMDSKMTPIKHAKLMVEQAKIIEKNILS